MTQETAPEKKDPERFPVTDDIREAMATIARGTDTFLIQSEFEQKLARSKATGTPLRCKLGLDPTAPDIHIGHTVVLNKLRQLQDLGHTVIFLVGDFPAAKPAPWIRSVVNVGSASGHTGSEFPEYAASKGGILSYTKNVANRLAPQGICNSVDPGGVLTELNRPVMDDAAMWERIMQLTPLRRWAEPGEIAEWVYFVGVTNRFMTGQNLLIDGGEAGAAEFVWPED